MPHFRRAGSAWRAAALWPLSLVFSLRGTREFCWQIPGVELTGAVTSAEGRALVNRTSTNTILGLLLLAAVFAGQHLTVVHSFWEDNAGSEDVGCSEEPTHSHPGVMLHDNALGQNLLLCSPVTFLRTETKP
jgi:hypothetical protein